MRYLMATMLAGSMALFAGHAKAADGMTIAVFTKNSTNPAYEAFRIAADQIARTTGCARRASRPEKARQCRRAEGDGGAGAEGPAGCRDFHPGRRRRHDRIGEAAQRGQDPGHAGVQSAARQFVTYVGADDFEIGYREAQYLFEHIGGKGKIVVIEGTPAAPTNRERVRGYQRAFAEFPGIQVLGSGVGNYQQPDAKRVMAKLLGEHPQIDAVLSANDSMALGVLEALKEASRTSIVISINGILPAVKQIETGAILATVDFNMFKIGCTATRAAVRHLKKEPLPEKVMLPAEVIDKTNYKAWLVPVDQRTCPEWGEVVK